MAIHLFKGAGKYYAFSNLPDGADLPDENGPWQLVETVTLARGDEGLFGLSADEVLDALETGIMVTEHDAKLER